MMRLAGTPSTSASTESASSRLARAAFAELRRSHSAKRRLVGSLGSTALASLPPGASSGASSTSTTHATVRSTTGFTNRT